MMPLARIGSLAATSTAAGHRATTLELLFDVVYVFAFIQVTHVMAHDEDGTGVLRGLAVLGVLWWAWASYAWLANVSVADRGVVRIGFLMAIAIVFVLSIAIPRAYRGAGDDLGPPLVFAIGFVLLLIVYTLTNLAVAGGNRALRRQVFLTMGVTIIPVSVALVAGALIGGVAQMVLWVAAVVVQGPHRCRTSLDVTNRSTDAPINDVEADVLCRSSPGRARSDCDDVWNDTRLRYHRPRASGNRNRIGNRYGLGADSLDTGLGSYRGVSSGSHS